jgi:hypothetical protein
LCNLHVTVSVCKAPSCFAPNSLQQNKWFFLLCGRLHNRKNWLFSNAKSGANASAMLYSIIETAKANGLTPFDYIMHCLEHLAASPDNVEGLLPWNVKLGKV